MLVEEEKNSQRMGEGPAEGGVEGRVDTSGVPR